MTKVGWNALATWRDFRMGEEGDLWHRGIIDPALLKLIGPVRGLRVVDIGCGNGYLTRRFKRKGARRSVGVDSSTRSISIARRRESSDPTGAEFVCADSAHVSRLPSASFDRVVANMSLMDIRDGAGTVREISRLLAPSGRAVISICHPCFDVDESSSWIVEQHPYRRSVARKVTGYRREGAFRVPWRVSEDEMAYTTSYHRTLATYSSYFADAALAIVRMAEPLPTPEVVSKSDQGPFLTEIPLHLLFELAHLETPRSKARTRRRPAAA